jgi:hypothetical protein
VTAFLGRSGAGSLLAGPRGHIEVEVAERIEKNQSRGCSGAEFSYLKLRMVE